VKAAINGTPVWQIREIAAQTGYCGQNALEAHVGLGNATSVDTIRVEWPSGLADVLADVAVNQFLTVTEGEALAADHDPDRTDTPTGTYLSAGCPNPFGAHTRIRFDLPAACEVTVAVFNVRGDLVKTLVRACSLQPGSHTAIWDGRAENGRRMSPGAYLCRIEAGGTVETRPVVLVK
jgi:hypothetical protein